VSPAQSSAHPNKTWLVDRRWKEELHKAAMLGGSPLRIICPFIKLGALDQLLRPHRGPVQVITRYNLDDFSAGVSDLSSLRRLLSIGAEVRGVRGLHAKVYLFGDRRAVVTSANLTGSGLTGNHEFGVVSEAAPVLQACGDYFDALWAGCGPNLAPAQVTDWEVQVTAHRATGAPGFVGSELGDFGAEIRMVPPVAPITLADQEGPPAFVKFLGQATNRAPLDHAILDELKSSGCHWALGYPADRRPRNVQDGSEMFMGRLTYDPTDIVIFGRATGMRHVDGRDDATDAEIADRDWKAIWPLYVRVHHAEFVTGTLRNGVSLNRLMDTLGQDAFASTQRNAAAGRGNVYPRASYRRQPSVRLSDQGHAWLNARFNEALRLHGLVSNEELAKLDWPERPSRAISALDDPPHPPVAGDPLL